MRVDGIIGVHGLFPFVFSRNKDSVMNIPPAVCSAREKQRMDGCTM